MDQKCEGEAERVFSINMLTCINKKRVAPDEALSTSNLARGEVESDECQTLMGRAVSWTNS